ncbi:MAG: hypothetical protein PHF21_01500 [Bacilli bacterium]|nr:hypothetical protein [Bacilli bacterium]
MKVDNPKREVEIAFARLIGPLATVTALESYKEDHKDYKDLLSIIIKWSANYMTTGKLSLIHHEELLDVYNKLDNLKGKWLFDANLGEESELADEIVIWMWEVMKLRKLEIEKKGMK